MTQAVLIAKQMPGTPVKLLWSREEDMLQGRYHPVMQCKLDRRVRREQQPDRAAHAALGAVDPGRGAPGGRARSRRAATRSRSRACSRAASTRSATRIPNLLIDHAMRNTHVPPGFWRGVNINQNAIFIECFMDELARGGGPGRARVPAQAHGEAPARTSRVLNAVAERIGWGKPAPEGVHRGLAQMKAFNSYVAARGGDLGDDGNKVKVHRIVARPIRGYAVNPAQIERQVAGSFVYGLSALFMQECTVKDGRIEQTNFHDYNSMRIAQMPKVESIIMPGRRPVWGGIGEPTICVAAPAVLNAFYRATGKRIRTVPLKNHGIEHGVRRCCVRRRFRLLCSSGRPSETTAIPASLTGAKGDPARGRAIVANRQVGLCLLCHSGPFPEERFQGDLAPDLRRARPRLTEGQIRLRIVDPARVNPADHHAGLLPHRRADARRAGAIAASRSSPRSRSRTSWPILADAEMTTPPPIPRRSPAARSPPASAAAQLPIRTSRRRRKAALEAAIRKVTGGEPVRTGRVKLDVPPLDRQRQHRAADGLGGEPDDAAPTTSRRSTCFTEKNPQPNVVSAYLGPRAGRASIATRVRIADTGKR